MSTKEFLYRYKEVDAMETKTMVQKNVKDHRKDLNMAVENIFKCEDEITIRTGDSKAVTFNKSLLVLFSKSMRICLASFSCCSEPVIVLPDCSAESVIKVHDILVKQFTKTGVRSFKDIQTVVEAASALGIDIADLDFGASFKPMHVVKKPVIVDVNLSDDEDDDEDEDESEDTIQEISPLDESSMDATFGTNKTSAPRPSEYEVDVSSDDSSDDDNDGSSSDGEVRVDENVPKTVSESVSSGKQIKMTQPDRKRVSSGKTLVNETLFSEDDENSDEESGNDEPKDMTKKAYTERDISDDKKPNERTSFEISGISEIQIDAEDTMNISASSDVLDEVLHYNKKFLQAERLKLEKGDMVPSENIANVNNSLDSLKGYISMIDEKLVDIGHKDAFHDDESNIPLKLITTADAQQEVSPLKDEINLPAKNKKNSIELKKENPSQEGNDYEDRFRCTICLNVMRKLAVSTFKEHYSTAHFQKEIFEMYIKSSTETICRVDGCGKEFGAKNKANLVRHIGSTHNKAMDILQLKGMEVPVVFTENNPNNKRKRSDVKVEKMSKVKTELEESSLPFECLMCGLYYSSKPNLERHMLSKH